MKKTKDDSVILTKIRRQAFLLGGEILIVSKPDRAKAFLINLRERIKQTGNIYQKLIRQIRRFKHLTHEVENLFDNYYIVDGAVADILNSTIDRGFRKLVQIEKKSNVFIPRAYLILAELLKSTDYKIDRETLYSFLQAYQTKASLSIRELSFVPFFLKTILIENIEDIMLRTMASLNEFQEAEYWFEQIVKKGGKLKERDYVKLTSNLANKYSVIPVNLGFYLLQKLSQYGPDTRPIVKWLKLNLLKQGINISNLAEIESRRQDDISIQIANTINSLRWINRARWDDFVVEVNIVDPLLKKDPAGVYSLLDQASQNVYRNELVKISDRAGVYESEIAKLTLRLCQRTPGVSSVDAGAENHVGYYLVGQGRDELEKKIGYQKSIWEKIRAIILKRAISFYLTLILVIDIVLTSVFALFFPPTLGQAFSVSILIALAFILNWDITISIINTLISYLIPVRALFRMDLSSGVSSQQSTFVVIPSMFRDQKSGRELLHRLEVNFLGNRADNVFFALLMDFKDAQTETTVSDQNLVEQINRGIEELNEKYPSAIKKFYIFHRRRIWNPHENSFMGWERKRGKLREFNLFLRNKRQTSYFESLPTDLPFIKYILTIDEDTRLPKDSAIKLIGCLDHPLNRPVLDPISGRVKSGYGIIQPRMTTKFAQARATAFSRLFSSAIGIDSYTGPAADVYQDLFNNSIFFGKGIYDVDVMEATIGDRIPENQVLSHDLLEGLYTRVGFATDIFLFEGFPESYKEYILRMHRWIRGDWQIVSWLKYNSIKNNIFALSDKWKIFDNLRRSTLPIFMILFLLIAYFFFPSHYCFALIFILLTIGSSFIISFFFQLFHWPKEMTWFMKIDNIFSNLDDLLVQIIYRFIFLLDQAIIAFRAIWDSAYRMLISRKYLLRWQNSHEVAKSLKGSLGEFVYLMLPAQIISIIFLLLLPKYHNGFYAYLTLIFWFISPFIAYQISRYDPQIQYSVQDLNLLRQIACRSSRFFLELSQRGGNRLIPDHYQEEPVTNSPAATSPTNIGLHLLSNLSAYDLGYISFSNLAERTAETFSSLKSMERYRGHFYNWYDIRTLQSLNPKYVSSVDSANLLINLLTFKQGILDICHQPIFATKSLTGLADVLTVLLEDANLIIKNKDIAKIDRKLARQICAEAKYLLDNCFINETVESLDYFDKIFTDLAEGNEKIKKIVGNLNLGLNRGLISSIYSSTEHFNVLLKQQRDEFNLLMPYRHNRQTLPILRSEKKNNLLAEALKQISLELDRPISLTDLIDDWLSEIESLNLITLLHSAVLDSSEKENIERWYHQVKADILLAEKQARDCHKKYQEIISLIEGFFNETDFAFLYNQERGLFHIGYNVTYDKIDNSYYDFLASEANAISFLAILKNDVPVKHWFYLARKLVRLDMNNVLLSSWGGSLFEYLTSLIFFKAHPESLLGQTARSAITGHIKYGRKYHVPWGMGESAYSALDLNNNYQYQIFGHPDLGFKRDLKNFLVVAPYTTIMSLAFKPKLALSNLRRLIKLNLLSRYGFYDAIDFSSRLKDQNDNQPGFPVKIYYAHHQGFSLQALNNQINRDRMHKLFIKDPRVEALDTLFEEKMPSSIPSRPVKNIERLPTEYLATGTDDREVKQFIPLYTSYPRRAFISNGSYAVNISNTGAGGSRVANLNLTRFREDPVIEPWGQFIYLFDSVKKIVWSPTTQPTGISLGKNKIEYFENRAHYNKIHNEIESSLTVAVAPDSEVEFRSLTLTNHGKDKKNLKITSYGEVALSQGNEDLHHTAFEKLFTKSEYWSKQNALVYIRPDKINRGKSLYFAHCLFTSSSNNIQSIHTADRQQFFSRGGSRREPAMVLPGSGKNKSALGYNFDPIFCFQSQLELKYNETATLTYVNVFGHSREEILKNLKKYSNHKIVQQAIKKSDQQGHEVVNSLGLSREQALNYQTLASRLLSPHYAPMVKNLNIVGEAAAVQSLWRLGLSGDRPILIVRFYDMNDLALIKNMLLGHRYLQYKGVAYDLVLLNEYPSSYIKSFEDEVDFLIRYNQSPGGKNSQGGVFHLRTSHMVKEDVENLLTLSKVIIDSQEGTIEQQINDLSASGSRSPVTYLTGKKKIPSSGRDIYPNLNHLSFFNQLGGFTDEGRAYMLNVNYRQGLYPPRPWVNIIANQDIGFIMTDGGSSYTWLFDSYDNRLTKRLDDPLIDRSSEVFYLRDEDTGEFWTPTPLPIKSQHTYTITHGLGYSQIEHRSRGIDQTMLAYVPSEETVKIIKFKLKNTTKLVKKLSLTGFFEMSVGGANREDNKDYLKTTVDDETGSIFIKNIYSESFKKTTVFIDFNGGQGLVTNDRDAFLGKGGDISNPGALHQVKLSNVIQSDVDHCVAAQTFFELSPGEEKSIIVLLGGNNSLDTIRNLVKKYRDSAHCESALKAVKNNWLDCLNKIQIKTPDESLNILFNSRLLYQLISSRLLARTGYYQPSGAYGFRDQLQDAMALVWTKPAMTKEIILKASRHQFLEGDAQNWWHEHNSFGVRTAFSDHQLWLPYVTSFYVEATGDVKILDEKESLMKAPLLDFINNPNWAGVPESSVEKYDLYDHCLRAIEKTFVFGQNGLPLIGNGDWNDGLNKVGEKGLGESVWLGWFLYYVIYKFIPLIESRNDHERVKCYEKTAHDLKNSLEKKAWDGRWYKRAFFDSSSPLGSRSNREFKIDSISQSWSVLSGAARADRSKQAMQSVSKHLWQDDLLLLLSPAVKESPLDPGYIRDYPAGVRENGAQYNHATLWAAQAFAKLKDPVSLMRIIDSVNPIKRSADKDKVDLYQVEPYAVASDIYAKPAEAGRGGWTWYTGSAGIMYCTILESLLGLKIKGDKMEINPCIPKEWPEFSVVYTYKDTKYNIRVMNLDQIINKKIRVDGELLSSNIINLINDGKDHEIEVKL